MLRAEQTTFRGPYALLCEAFSDSGECQFVSLTKQNDPIKQLLLAVCIAPYVERFGPYPDDESDSQSIVKLTH